MKHGFSIAVMLPHHFATEDDGEDDLQREPDAADDGDKPFAHIPTGELDLRIRLTETELKCLRALRDGDKPLALKLNREMQRLDQQLAKLRGLDEKEQDDGE